MQLLTISGCVSTLIHLDYVRTNHLGYLVSGQLVYQVPQLHIRLLRALGVLECYRSLQGKLFKQLRLAASQLANLLDLVFFERLVALELKLSQL